MTTLNPHIGHILSAPVITVDWEADGNEAWSVPTGTGIAKTLKIGGTTWRCQVDAIDYFVVQNPLNHYNFNNYSDLTFEENGDLVIFCGLELLDGYHESNWLPTPKDKNFSLSARLYGPRKELSEGDWFMPEIRVVK